MKKTDRKLIFDKYNGLCAYCGTPLLKGWHVDELEPCIRLYEWQQSHWRHKVTKEKTNVNKLTEDEMKDYEFVNSRQVFKGYQYPERLNIENQMPACASCNINKHSGSLEEFRSLIKGFMKHLNEINTQYKIAKRYGLVTENDIEVKFYFETLKKN
jgi:5-methylcytosine-specific restriction endonuclease McrA